MTLQVLSVKASSARPFCLGIPILGMELMLGQVLQKGVTDGMAMLHARAWGIGAAASLGAFLLASYYGVIMSWVWSFLIASMREVMPFSDGRAADFFYTDVLAQPRAGRPLEGGLGPCHWWLVLGLMVNWVGRCSLPVSKPELKAPLVSAISALN